MTIFNIRFYSLINKGLPEDVMKAMTEYGLLQVETTGEVEGHIDLV